MTEPPVRSVIQIGNALESGLEMAGSVISDGVTQYRPNYQMAIIQGYRAPRKAPQFRALEDFRFAYSVVNLQENAQGPQHAAQPSMLLAGLVSEYKALLETAEREEDLQKFLARHPEFICPDYIRVYPKFKLADDLVTDFVFLVQSDGGQEYVFVEIEKISKRICTKEGWFTSDFTQAKNQLLDWDAWVQKNSLFIIQKLPGIFKPRYQLIMGRSQDLESSEKERLRSEFQATNRSFSTYDDLADRMETLSRRLLEMSL